jgi:Lipopolysaccharide biosynthesis protein
MKRIGIFCFYDKDGIVDRYVEYFLRELMPFLERLVIVCNGELTDSGKRKLSQFADEIIVRPNEGYDISAYREGMLMVGWEELACYEEVLLFNDTVYGPVYPFSELFSEMSGREKIDFWGLTRYHGHEDPQRYKMYPEHIQSYWTVFRKKFVSSVEFQQYWRNLGKIRNYDDAVQGHEATFTRKFEKLGYQWDVYIDTRDIEEINSYPLLFIPHDLLEKKRCPVVKRTTFTVDYSIFLFNSLRSQAREVLSYLQKNDLYDIDLIIENLLRIAYMCDLKNNLQLNYILPEDMVIKKCANCDTRAGLIMHLCDEEDLDSSLAYLSAMPDGSEIFIMTDSKEKKERILLEAQKYAKNYLITVQIVVDQAQNVEGILLNAKAFILKHDLICFGHDRKEAHSRPKSISRGVTEKSWMGILQSKEFVENICATFMNNKYLGLLIPPLPNHSIYYGMITKGWVGKFDVVMRLLKKMRLDVPIDRKKEPIVVWNSMFWFRVDALKPLLTEAWETENFQEKLVAGEGVSAQLIEHACSHIAQSQGYFSGWVMPSSLAAIEITNLNHSISIINKQLNQGYKIRRIQDVVKIIRKFRYFSKKYWKNKLS